MFLINFAIGVATGIVQEFQFGMNWSEYSRFVGDVFGAPLAMEGLVAFFFESTFIGLWIFGWSRLPQLAAPGLASGSSRSRSTLSAFFIIAANSFMQHPVGARFNPETGRAELQSITALFTNNTGGGGVLRTPWPASFLDRGDVRGGGLRVVDGAVAKRPAPDRRAHHVPPGRDPRLAGGAGRRVGLFFTGDVQGKLMFHQQPMKMASAESLCHTETDPDFSILTVGTHNNCDSITRVIEVPYVLPFLAEGKFSGVTLQGVKDLQQQYEQRFGPE